MHKNLYLKVALNVPLLTTFDYLPPANVLTQHILLGQRIKVPFRKQTRVGVIVGLSDKSNLPSHKIKQALAIIDETPALNEPLLTLAFWLSDYYHAGIGEVLSAMLPHFIRQGKALTLEPTLIWKASKTANLDLIKRAPKQKRAFDIIKKYPAGLTKDQLNTFEINAAIIKALHEKGLIIQETHDYQAKNTIIKEEGLTLNTEQTHAVEKISQQRYEYNTWVLNGVTGSGKTEVYLQLIAKVLAENKQCLVLVPEIGLTPQTIARFSNRFDTDIVVLHSGLSDSERHHAWVKAKLGIAKIIIGTRSAVFTAVKDLGLIVVDEAHDLSFKQQESIRYHARDVAIKRAQMLNIPIILGSATHNLETLYNVKLNRFKIIDLHQRAGAALAPTFSLLDIRNQYLKEGISSKALEAIDKKLKQNEQVLIFLNRRGYAPALMCHHCGWIAQCQRCDAKMTYHLQPLHLHCHHCNSTKPLYEICPHCQSHNLLAIGLGTVKVEKVLNAVFPSANLIRVDKDSTRSKHAMHHYLESIYSGKANILIGTQMLAKGHHFPNVTLVIILDGDSGFFSADFRATETFAQTLMQVSGRAGRSHKPGEVMIQTRNPEHPQLQSLIHGGYQQFVNEILQERQTANLPPFSFLSLIRAHAKNHPLTHEFLEQVKALAIKYHSSDIKILGPIDSPMAKRAGNYHAQLLFQANNRVALKHFLSQLIHDIHLLNNANRVRWSLDVDPVDLYL